MRALESPDEECQPSRWEHTEGVCVVPVAGDPRKGSPQLRCYSRSRVRGFKMAGLAFPAGGVAGTPIRSRRRGAHRPKERPTMLVTLGLSCITQASQVGPGGVSRLPRTMLEKWNPRFPLSCSVRAAWRHRRLP